MKSELEPQDIEAIAGRVAEMLRTLLRNIQAPATEEVFTPESLANYLKVDVSWVYKAVSKRTLPYHKVGKYIRFTKSTVDKWLESKKRVPVTDFERMRKNVRVA